MTTTDSEVIEKYETATIEALDFPLPCDLQEVRRVMLRRVETQCPNPAAWVLVMRPHHPSHIHAINTVLICQEHYEYVVGGGTMWCEAMGGEYKVSDYIVRLEPLKPTGGTK